MPMWNGYWGGPWYGFGWVFPLVGLLFMVVMVFACIRMMANAMGGRARHSTAEVDELRREVRDLKEKVQELRQRTE